jgi:cytochrome c peroxidase
MAEYQPIGLASRVGWTLILIIALSYGIVLTLRAADAESSAALGLPEVSWPSATVATRVQIELGRKLFMDRRLSPNNTMSCAMCHIPEQGFAANELATAVGINGRSVKRNAPTLLNVAFNAFLFWDGRETSLENQVWQPILNPKEMGNASTQAVLDKINALADYAGLFERAYGGARATSESVAHAVAAYERTLVAGGSRFDRWFYAREQHALSALEQQGFAAFNRFGCAQCHSYGDTSALFTDQRFHNTGIGWAAARTEKTYTVPLAPGVSTQIKESELANVSEAIEADEGRFEATRNDAERYRYKTPSLRNVELTAPYMHDGSLATLEEVIDFYARGGIDNPGRDVLLNPIEITARDKQALAAFLRALTSAEHTRLAQQARR